MNHTKPLMVACKHNVNAYMYKLSPWCHMYIIASRIYGNSTVCSIACPDSTKTPTFRITGPLWWEPPVTGGFPSQMDSDVESVSLSWYLDTSSINLIGFLYPRPTKLEGEGWGWGWGWGRGVGGGYSGFTLSVHLSVRPSVCRRHGFRSICQVSCGISISNVICMLMVAIGRSLLIFSDVTFKMAPRRPYWIFWFPDSNFTLALNINFKLQRHNTYVYG